MIAYIINQKGKYEAKWSAQWLQPCEISNTNILYNFRVYRSDFFIGVNWIRFGASTLYYFRSDSALVPDKYNNYD